jgi:hypothetical protein
MAMLQQQRESDYFDSSIFTFSGFANSLGPKFISPYPLYHDVTSLRRLFAIANYSV